MQYWALQNYNKRWEIKKDMCFRSYIWCLIYKGTIFLYRRIKMILTILLVLCVTGWAYANVSTYEEWFSNIIDDILFFFVQNVLSKILMNSHAVIFRTTFDFSTLIFTACLHIFLPIASVSIIPEHITCNTIYAHFLKRCSHYFWLT